VKPEHGAHSYFDESGQRRTARVGDVFTDYPDNVAAFPGKFEQLDPSPPPEEPKAGLHLERLAPNQWNVINESTGEPINDEPMTANAARSLMAETRRNLEEGVEEID
jgi:sarcosine oxidase gamma subunit